MIEIRVVNSDNFDMDDILSRDNYPATSSCALPLLALTPTSHSSPHVATMRRVFVLWEKL